MSDVLLAGWANADITPPLGARLRGYFHERLAEGVHDPLQAKALYLESGGEVFVFVAMDLCAGDRRLTARARELVAAEHGLPPERLVLHATHTHLGPFAYEHVDLLAGGVAKALRAARQAAVPVQVRRGVGHEESVSFCRRFVMRDGSVRTNPGRGNPDVVRPTAPVDPQVRVAMFEPQAGGRRLVVVNFALHLDTVGGCVMSADWPHYLEQLVRRVHPEVDVLFVQGCAGDVNHVDVHNPQPAKGFAMAEEIGTVLGAEVLKVLARLQPAEATPLRVASATLPIEVPVPTAAEVAEAQRIREAGDTGVRAAFVGASRTIALAERGSPLPVEVTAARIGDVGLVAMPGEMFCAYGLRAVAESPAALTLVAELCHDDVRYVPTADALQAGGYESWNSLLPPAAGERMTTTAIELLGGLFA